MKYSIFLHPENTETVCLKILSHLCFSPTLFDLNYEHLNFGHLWNYVFCCSSIRNHLSHPLALFLWCLKGKSPETKKQWDCLQQEWFPLFTILLRFHCRKNLKRCRFFFEPNEALVLLSSFFTIAGRICGPHSLAMPQVLLKQTFWQLQLLLQSKCSVYKMIVSNWGKTAGFPLRFSKDGSI